CARRNEDADVW
nr:immunoglobulin heavy chain junction region [Macaca mulatta]MOX91683.1 immunoglobulin heavy chain junction region [Macaca mulatta]MOX91740.1 immunoglobulin heavy chain junction region [Macaca mulatta]MOX91991.1 immunoglobulin heavy chain junction region [Macaca mulatta]MOX92040.1 immunoglobulin heavy chain junction region [Macaca mulatta]